MTASREDRLLGVIAAARQRSSDRAIIRTMRLAIWGVGAIVVVFLAYVVAAFFVDAHDRRIDARIDALERRVEKLEAEIRGARKDSP